MDAMVAFYERLGVTFAPTFGHWKRHHQSFAQENILDGFDFDIDSTQFVAHWNEGWPGGTSGPVFGFRMPSRESVDSTYEDLLAAGYQGQQPPWDGFMGARHAVVQDPDGNAVGLMGPIDPERRWMPDLPADSGGPARAVPRRSRRAGSEHDGATGDVEGGSGDP